MKKIYYFPITTILMLDQKNYTINICHDFRSSPLHTNKGEFSRRYVKRVKRKTSDKKSFKYSCLEVGGEVGETKNQEAP
jgi:ribosomal protein RSM22 (predicted rRNA methylase)